MEKQLIDYLLKERNEKINQNQYSFDLYRALVNTRKPKEISENYLKIEDKYLKELNDQKGIIEIKGTGIHLWQGDITRLKVDAIVNAANNQMLGCFIPGHYCIDNAIHTYAGIRLRLACYELMKKQGYLEPTGKCKVTNAYQLPSRYVFHTVGPIVQGQLTNKHRLLLTSCYESCLKKADELGLTSIAFCCISTGVFHFPQDIAASIAIDTVSKYLHQAKSLRQIIFNVFKDEDLLIYQQMLKERGLIR